MVVMHFAFGLVYRNLVVVNAETIALSIAVYKEAALQELVRREADARTWAGVMRLALPLQNSSPDCGSVPVPLLHGADIPYGARSS